MIKLKSPFPFAPAVPTETSPAVGAPMLSTTESREAVAVTNAIAATISDPHRLLLRVPLSTQANQHFDKRLLGGSQKVLSICRGVRKSLLLCPPKNRGSPSGDRLPLVCGQAEREELQITVTCRSGRASPSSPRPTKLDCHCHPVGRKESRLKKSPLLLGRWRSRWDRKPICGSRLSMPRGSCR